MKGHLSHELLLESSLFYRGYFSGLLLLNKKKTRPKLLTSLLSNLVTVATFCHADLILKPDFKKRKMVNVPNHFSDNPSNKDSCGFKSFRIICIEELKLRVKVRPRATVRRAVSFKLLRAP